jgi:hypothetical protein
VIRYNSSEGNAFYLGDQYVCTMSSKITGNNNKNSNKNKKKNKNKKEQEKQE